MQEIFKMITEYPNYEVSNLGRIKMTANDASRKERFLKALKAAHGYQRVCLWKDKKGDFKSIHRLVAQYFIPNLDKLPQVNHKDAVKTNNKAANLEWCTGKGNREHAKANNLYAKGEKSGMAKLTELQVREIHKRLSEGEKISDLKKEYNVCHDTIYVIKKAQFWKHLNLPKL